MQCEVERTIEGYASDAEPQKERAIEPVDLDLRVAFRKAAVVRESRDLALEEQRGVEHRPRNFDRATDLGVERRAPGGELRKRPLLVIHTRVERCEHQRRPRAIAARGL